MHICAWCNAFACDVRSGAFGCHAVVSWLHCSLLTHSDSRFVNVVFHLSHMFGLWCFSAWCLEQDVLQLPCLVCFVRTFLLPCYISSHWNALVLVVRQTGLLFVGELLSSDVVPQFQAVPDGSFEFQWLHGSVRRDARARLFCRVLDVALRPSLSLFLRRCRQSDDIATRVFLS